MIYVIQVEPEREVSVCMELNRSAVKAYVPRRELTVRKSAGWTKITNPLFPCYVFIDSDYSAELFHRVKKVSGVLRFLGSPSPIRADEENFMRILFNGGKVIRESKAVVDGSGAVAVTGGWLMGKEQYVKYWNVRQKKASVEITFGGRKHRANVGVEFN